MFKQMIVSYTLRLPKKIANFFHRLNFRFALSELLLFKQQKKRTTIFFGPFHFFLKKRKQMCVCVCEITLQSTYLSKK